MPAMRKPTLLGQIARAGRNAVTQLTLRDLIAVLALVGVYFCAGKLGLSWAHINRNVSVVWPPSGLALAALLLWGSRLWPGVFLGAFLVNINTQGTLLTALGIATGNTLEALVGAWALNRFANGAKAFERARNTFRFVVLAPVLSTIVSATLGVASLTFTGFAQPELFIPIWFTWWLGDAVGELIFAPLVVIWMTQPYPQCKPARVIEAAGLLVLLSLIGHIVFIRGDSSSPEYIFMLPLLWAAFRFGQRGAVTSALIISAIALAGTLYGLGPYADAAPNESLIHLESFISTLAIAALVLASVLSESKRAEQRLEVQESISRILAESPSIKDATPLIVQVLCKRAGWDLGAVWILNRSATELQYVDIWQMPEVEAPEFKTATRLGRIIRGTGLPGKVWSSGETHWIRDVTTEPDFRRAPIASKEGLHGAFAFPIKAGAEILGVVECYSREVREVDDHFLQVINDIGTQLGQFLDRKRAEDEIRAQRLQLRVITDVTPVLLAQCSRDFTYTFVNRAYAAMLGLPAEEIIGKPMGEIIGAEAFEKIRPYLETVLGGRSVEYELEIASARVGMRCLRVVDTPEIDNQGRTRGWIASMSDITERKRAEDEIAALNQQLALDLSAMMRLQALSARLVEAHEIGSLMEDILSAAIEIAGADMGNVQLMDRETNVLKIVAQRGFESAFADFFTAVHAEMAVCGEAMARGERIVIEDVAASPIFAGTPFREAMLSAGVRAVQSTPLVSRSGRIVGMFLTHYRQPHLPNERHLALLDLLARQAAELVERSETEALLLNREQHLRAVIETAADGIITIDERETITTVNPAAERIFGYSARELVGHSVRLLLPESKASGENPYIGNDLNTGGKKAIGIGREIDGQRKDGSMIPLDLAVSETRIGERRLFIAMMRDIAERKRADDLLRQAKDDLLKANEDLERRVRERTRDLEQANAALLRTIAGQKKLEDQLRQAQKMESIGTLAGGIAHDFNNILNIIRGYATLIGQQPIAGEQLEESLRVIDKEIDRGASVVRQLLTIARKTETHLAPTNISDIVLTLNELIKTFPKNITVALNLDTSLLPVLADRNQLSQVLLNICLNARDAMAGGGKLMIRTEKVDAAEMRVRHMEAPPGTYVCVVISDTGIGMTEEVRVRMFEPFFTTKGISEGTGLGLAIVYGVVREHNGFIDVDSELGCGTTFRLYLPVLESTQIPFGADKPRPVPAPENPLHQRGTILVVEDEEALVRLLKKLLPREGYRVLTAMDGEEGIGLYQDHKAEIDVVLLDLGLPKMTGMDVIPKLKEQNPNVNIVIATGYLEPELKAELFHAGVRDCIHKPYLLTEVLEKLDAALENSRPPQSSQASAV